MVEDVALIGPPEKISDELPGGARPASRRFLVGVRRSILSTYADSSSADPTVGQRSSPSRRSLLAVLRTGVHTTAAAPPRPRPSSSARFGASIEGRPIVASRRRDAGRHPVLAIGSIHGDEQAGIEIAEHLRDMATIPDGLDVWLVPTTNPDGNAASPAPTPRVSTSTATSRRTGHWSTAPPSPGTAPAPRRSASPRPVPSPISSLPVPPRPTVVYHGADHVVSVATDVVASLARRSPTPGVPATRSAPSPARRRAPARRRMFTNAAVTPSTAFTVELSSRPAAAMSPAAVDDHVAAFFAAAAAL